MNACEMLVDFVEKTDSLGNGSKLRLLLFLNKAKPNTYVRLKITPKSLEDKQHFEKHINELGIPYFVSRPKGFEEIDSIQGNKIKWKASGVWYGYDLFHDGRARAVFNRYKLLLKHGNHIQADKTAGKHYGYPKCCVENYIAEQHKGAMARNTYYHHYSKLHKTDRMFPFISHTPCKVNCAASKKLNARYKQVLKKISANFYKRYVAKNKYLTPVIVDTENDVLQKGKTIWPVRNGHDYNIITYKRIRGKHWLISALTRKTYQRGDIYQGKIITQHDHATIYVGKKIKTLAKLHHERRFLIP